MSLTKDTAQEEMNIFQDLVDELKQENLLEDTVVETPEPKPEPQELKKPDPPKEKPKVKAPQEDRSERKQAVESSEPAPVDLPAVDEFESELPMTADEQLDSIAGEAAIAGLERISSDDPDIPGIVVESTSEEEPVDDLESLFAESEQMELESLKAVNEAELGADSEEEELIEDPEPVEEIEHDPDEEPEVALRRAEMPKPGSAAAKAGDSKFFKQRAMDEVMGLQLVEHVISGVERELMRKAPQPFDDLKVKRALHNFVKVAEDINSPEHAQCEFQLMQETENWASALSRRDRNIPVGHLRRFCETTKPSLSSQALISLARFYRNSPYSENVRGKFDLVFTRLFSKDAGGEERAVVFDQEETIEHIKELYADWASIPVYSSEEDDEALQATIERFQQFVYEANNTESFEQILKKDFFKRIKAFKESAGENFFAPVVIAEAIECNVAVGNRYIQLLRKEKEKSNTEEISEKYSNLITGSISEATSKTLEIVELLNTQKPEPIEEVKPLPVKAPKKKQRVKKKLPNLKDKRGPVTFNPKGGARSWLIAATVVVAIACGWFFFQNNLGEGGGTSPANGTAKEFTLEGTTVYEHVHSARISKNTLYGITRESWTKLGENEKKGVLTEALKLGEGQEFVQVHFLDKEGKSVGFASEKRLETK